MNVLLWIVAAALALAFLGAGLFKLTQPKENLYAKGMTYVEDYSATQVKLIGLVELLGAIGLIVPPLVGVAPILAPIAAVGLALTMVGAVLVHIRRGEGAGTVPAIVLGLLAVFVAVGRFWIAPF